MKKLLALFLLLASPAIAADNYQATEGSGKTFRCVDVGGICYTVFTPYSAGGNVWLYGNGATGTGSPRFTIANDNTIPTGWPTAAGIAAINTTLGTPMQATGGTVGIVAGTAVIGHVICDSGCSGSGGTSSSFGAAFPAAGTAIGLYDGTNMVRAKGDETSGLWVNIKAGAGSGGTALADEASFTQGTTNTTPLGCLYATSITNLTAGQAGVARCTNDRQQMVNDAALITSSASILAAVQASIPAGTALIGKVGIDQTTPGTTNGVQVNAAIPAGTNLMGKVGIDQTTPGTTNGVQVTNATAPITPSDGAANPTTAVPVITFSELWNGSTWDRAPGSATGGATVRQSSQYPVGATAITASATGTTAATTATLAGTSGKTTYICGYSIRANATAAVTVTNTITGVITATLSSIMWVAPAASGIGVDEQIFSPCIPASATNTGIAVVSGAPGTGGLVSSRGWGYQL